MARINFSDGSVFDTDEYFDRSAKMAVSTAKRAVEEVKAGQREVKETTVKVGKKVSEDIKAEANRQHEETRDHMDRNTERVLHAVDDANGTISGWKIFVSFLCALLASWGTWLASNGYIVKDVLDAVGNPVGQAPYMPYIILLMVLAAVAAFFVVAAILSLFGKRR